MPYPRFLSKFAPDWFPSEQDLMRERILGEQIREEMRSQMMEQAGAGRLDQAGLESAKRLGIKVNPQELVPSEPRIEQQTSTGMQVLGDKKYRTPSEQVDVPEIHKPLDDKIIENFPKEAQPFLRLYKGMTPYHLIQSKQLDPTDLEKLIKPYRNPLLDQMAATDDDRKSLVAAGILTEPQSKMVMTKGDVHDSLSQHIKLKAEADKAQKDREMKSAIEGAKLEEQRNKSIRAILMSATKAKNPEQAKMLSEMARIMAGGGIPSIETVSRLQTPIPELNSFLKLLVGEKAVVTEGAKIEPKKKAVDEDEKARARKNLGVK